MTSKNVLVLIVVVIVLALIAVGISYFVPNESDTATTTPEVLDETSEPLVVIHSFEDGVHTFSVSIEAPSPCHQVSQSTAVAESLPEQITLDIRVDDPEEGRVCAQVVSQALVTAEVTASEDAILTRVTLNGEEVPFEIFEEAKG